MVPHNNARNGSCTNNGRLLFVYNGSVLFVYNSSVLFVYNGSALFVYNGSVNNAPGAVALIIIIMCSVVIMSGQ